MIVLDSSFLVGFHNQRDAHHKTACALMERRDLGVAARVGRLLGTFEIFTHQGNTRLSFADAAIAHVALERAGGLVLTFDEEFGKLPGIRIPAESAP